ncbi:N-acyl homoserine lactonase family protein [Thermosyntropha sp.]|uniref:N-acyl homoserine lactonase family protein n=1 Tax=Thermosyntropha sp. TaxID=2740820 RepID=UPI0025EC53EC|nr:N-acyl homoserine lactonase family protein [Thermosyntropha sp.]MBO8158863.1 N-acyl homoserine lactonase family protein [Thermosyntropha sp.]
MMNYKITPIYNGSFIITLASGNNFFKKSVKIPSFIFLLQSEDGENLLVDTGFDPSFIPGSKSTYERTQKEELLNALYDKGIHPDDISMVIQTHLHWDHTGGIPCFPKAQFYLQALELKKLIEMPVYAETSFCPRHFMPYLSRFTLLNGSLELRPGIEICFTNKHTPGHQALIVNTNKGKVALIGDALFDYGEWWKNIPEEFWEKYRQGIGKHLFWQENIRQDIKKFLISKQAFNLPEPESIPVSEIEKKSNFSINSHDPRLFKTETI